MSLETAFENLSVHLQQLRDALLGLRLSPRINRWKATSCWWTVFGDAAADLMGG